MSQLSVNRGGYNKAVAVESANWTSSRPTYCNKDFLFTKLDKRILLHDQIVAVYVVLWRILQMKLS